MKDEDLAHVLRAAIEIVGTDAVVVIGSQAVLATHSFNELPEDATFSVEADLAFFDDPQFDKADMVDGAIGESSQFHESFGYYGQGVSLGTATLPSGWEDRLVPLDVHNGTARCIDIHDCVISKLVAGRDKDFEFAEALLRHDLVVVATLIERSTMLPQVHQKSVQVRIERCARRAGYGTGPVDE